MQTDVNENLRAAILHTCTTFHKHKRKLRGDLSPRFWVALLDLEIIINDSDLAAKDPSDAEIRAEVIKNYRWLGAPGDFGYGTPCGDALKALYAAHAAAVNHHKATAEANA